MPLFTIATITYNQKEWVRQAIESVLAATYADFEYIIADDGSTDGTWDIIRQYNDPRIRAWRNEKNKGEYPNRNDVLSKATGDFILFVDGDDILYKDSLETYARYIAAYPDTGGVWGVHPPFVDFMVFPYYIQPDSLSKFNFLSRVPISVIGLTETLFRAEYLRKLGGFDLRFGISDTHTKKKFSCYFPVVLTASGKGFWRQPPNQASQRVTRNMRNLVETFTMDKEIIESKDFPLSGAEREQAHRNFRNRRMKLIFSMTLLRADIPGFFRLMRELQVPLSDIAELLRKGDYSYRAGADAAHPLMTDFNFAKNTPLT